MEEFNSAEILKKQDRKKRFALLEIGLFEISFVLIIIITFFGLLNYFNILSLSTLYPNQLAFLPHQDQKINKQAAVSTPNSKSSPAPIFYGKKELPSEKISEYQAYVKEKNFASKTTIGQDKKSFAVDGIFSAFAKQQIQLITADGIIDFTFNSSTTFEQMSLAKTSTDSASTAFVISKTYTGDTFPQSVRLGEVVQIYFTDNGNSNLSATKIIYYPDLK